MLASRLIQRIALSVLFATATSIPLRGGADDISGVISGHAYDWSNHPLNGVTISLQSVSSPSSARTTGRGGYFTFLAVLPGEYRVSAALTGWVTCNAYLTIFPNQTKSVYFRMLHEAKRIGYCNSYERLQPISF